MKGGLNLRVGDVMDSAKLLGQFFAGDSWATWRAVLKATFAEPMSAEEVAAFRAVADRRPPRHRVSEAVFIVGRGGGKDSVASLAVTAIAVNFDPKGKLRPGEVATVMCIAVDREQAKIILSYIRGYFDEVPPLRALLVKTAERDTLTLRNGVEIVVATNSYRAIRGRTILAAVFDEVAFWRDETSRNPDVEVAAAVAPGLGRMPGSMSILISTAHKRSGLLYERWKRGYGLDNDDLLVVRGTTTQFNPLYDARVIARHLAEDKELYSAEYNSEWRDDLQTFLARDLIESAVDPGVTVRPPQAGVQYVSFCDPSGGRNDSFTLAISHRWQDGSVALDLLYERKPPFSPSEVAAELTALLKTYSVRKLVGDNYAAEYNVELFARVGVLYERSETVASDIYLNALPLFTSGRVHLLDSDRCVSQLASLERRSFAGGRDKIVHPTNAHDDLANAAAGALVLADSEQAPMVITRAMVERARSEVPAYMKNRGWAPGKAGLRIAFIRVPQVPSH